jgi:hypothetical protein
MAPRKDLTEIIGDAAHAVCNPDVVIVHEDFPSGLAARRLLEQLFVRANSESNQVFKMWEFGTLRLLGARTQAVREAAAAAIVCVSAHGDNSLLMGVKDWAERWARQPFVDDCALIVLLDTIDRSPAGNTPMIQFLRHAANLRGAAFLLCSTAICEPQENSWEESTQGLCNLAR